VSQLGEIRRDLERRFPSWRIWYVRELHGTALWFAQQGQQLLDEHDAGDLAADIEDIEACRTPGQAGPA
jgi:hypothetical protein